MRAALSLALAIAAVAQPAAVAHEPGDVAGAAGGASVKRGAPGVRLAAYAELPAATFVPGPTAGRWQGAGTIAAHAGPYPGKQPVQGLSGVVPEGGWFTVLVDNGFGALETSADHRLTLYRMRPRWGGPGKPGTVSVGPATLIRDPRGHLPWTITHQFLGDRQLTGADLDPESIVRAPDGTYWIGDEFGPFLVHVRQDGMVMAPPIRLPDPERAGAETRSPQNPFNEESASVRLLGALRAHAEAHGGKLAPVLSPWHVLIADGDPATKADGRRPGESEIVDLKSVHGAGFKVVPWTVNERARMDALLALGVDGIISDSPDTLREAIAAFDADKDGRPGDFLDADGNVDAAKFDAEGHRGARDLRPESTLPGFEAALDAGMTTLETDCGVTKDGVAVLSHDPHLEPAKTRRLDGRPMPAGAGPAIRSMDLATLQRTYDRGVRLAGRPRQTLDPAASPVATAFAKANGLPSPHAVITLPQLFAFVRAYEWHYRAGDGQAHPLARRRANAAARVRFDLETKTNPADERAGLVPTPAAFVAAVAGPVRAAGLAGRTTIQSFDYRTLLEVHKRVPAIATAFLLEDALPFAMRGPGAARDVAPRAPYWPWRVTAATRPPRAKRSGGFEGMAASPDGRHLYPILEKPLTGASPDQLGIFEFDTRAGRWTGRRWRYPWDRGATSVADFILVNPRQGLAIERDDGEGHAAKLKKLYLVTLGAPGTVVRKELVADLMAIADPRRLAGPGQPGDVARGAMFGMPFWTIEGVAVLDPTHVLILNDNNYPYSSGRHKGTGAPDDDEWAVLELPRPLPVDAGFKPVRWR